MKANVNVRNRWDIVSWLATITLAVAAVITVIFSFWSVRIMSKDLKLKFRPYVGIQSIYVNRSRGNELDISLEIKNVGNTPANDVDVDIIPLASFIRQDLKIYDTKLLHETVLTSKKGCVVR